MKFFVSLMLCLLGVNYFLLLTQIWLDTAMRIDGIIGAYRGVEPEELVEHSVKWLFWFLGTFGMSGFLFLNTSYSDKMKRPLAILVPLAIASDITSMWLIRCGDWFAWQLFGSGLVLASCFLFMFCLIQYELWREKR